MMKSVRDIYTRYVGGGLSGESGLIHIVNNVVNDRNCGFVFAPKTFDTIVTLSNFLVCVLDLYRFSFVLYHFSLFLFYPCPVFLLYRTFYLSFFSLFFFPSLLFALFSPVALIVSSNTCKVAQSGDNILRRTGFPYSRTRLSNIIIL